MARRTRILLVASGAVPGVAPYGPAAQSMAQGLYGQLDIVSVKVGHQAHQGRLQDARIFRVNTDRSKEVFVRAVLRQYQSERYDVVHVLGPTPVPELIGAGARQVIYEPVADGLDGNWPVAHHAALGAAHAVIVPSQAAHSAVRRVLSATTPVEYLPPAVALDEYDWQPSVYREAALRALFVGRVQAARDIDCLLGAVKVAAAERPIHLMMVGEPDAALRQELRARVARLGIAPSITIRSLPSTTATPRLVAGADVGVVSCASHPAYEVHGLLPDPLLPFLAAHRPVICPDFPGVRQLGIGATALIHYRPGNVASLANAFQSLPPATNNAALDAAHRTIRERHAWSARQRALRKLYNKLLPGSQDIDPWLESFADEGTGAYAAVPPSDSEIEGEMTRARSSSSMPPNPRKHDALDAESTNIDALHSPGTDPG